MRNRHPEVPVDEPLDFFNAPVYFKQSAADGVDARPVCRQQ
jgi:hypothetical protein